MRCFTAIVTAPNGLHARPCAMLTTLQTSYFPKDDIIAVNLATKQEAPLGSLMAVMLLALAPGSQLEFVTAMDEKTFQDLTDILTYLSFEATTDVQGRPDANYSTCRAVTECDGDRKLLIARLKAASEMGGGQRLFERVGEPPAIKSELSLPPAPGHPSVDKPAPNQVFISHSHNDVGFVNTEMVPLLRSAGFKPWFSVDSIRGADRWERSILEGLQGSQWFTVVMSPNATKSEWVRLEVHWASEHRQGKIIPIMMSECNPWEVHMRLGYLQYIDFRHEPKEGRNSLLSILTSHS